MASCSTAAIRPLILRPLKAFVTRQGQHGIWRSDDYASDSQKCIHNHMARQDREHGTALSPHPSLSFMRGDGISRVKNFLNINSRLPHFSPLRNTRQPYCARFDSQNMLKMIRLEG